MFGLRRFSERIGVLLDRLGTRLSAGDLQSSKPGILLRWLGIRFSTGTVANANRPREHGLELLVLVLSVGAECGTVGSSCCFGLLLLWV